MQYYQIFFWCVVIIFTLTCIFRKTNLTVRQPNVAVSNPESFVSDRKSPPLTYDIHPIVLQSIPFCKAAYLKYRIKPSRVINALEHIPNDTDILFHKVYEHDSMESQGITIPVASHATHIRLEPGIVFYHPEHVVLDKHWNIYRFNHDNIDIVLPRDRLNCSAVHYHPGKLMIFIRPWAYVYSHIVATVLPVLHFACQQLQSDPDIVVLVVSQLQQELMCEVCSAVCQPYRVLNYQSIGWRLPVIADILYFPFFWHPAMEWPLGMYPANTLRSLPSPPMKRGLDLVYMPRPNTTSRHVQNEKMLLQAVCSVLSYSSRVQLKIFHSSLSYRSDRLQFSSAAIMLSPHSGAMANMLFLPPTATVVEFIDLSKGNPYYIGLCRVLGLKHMSIVPLMFDHYNVTIPLVVDVQSVLNALLQLEPLKSHPPSPNRTQDKAHIHKCLRIVDRELA